ncbi:MAG: DUF2306 domain-containing protein, partial [Mycobacterium sp.]
ALSVLWIWTTYRGYRSAREGDVAAHQAWMIRSFALTYSAPMLRLSLDSSGTWTLRFTIDGPHGEGTGDLVVDVLKQPGPPLALSWLVGLTPLALTLVFFVVVWIRTGQRRNADTSS